MIDFLDGLFDESDTISWKYYSKEDFELLNGLFDDYKILAEELSMLHFAYIGEDSTVNPVLLFLSGEKENTLVIAAIYNNIDLFGKIKQQIDTKVYDDFGTQATMDQIIADVTLVKTTLDQMSKLAKVIVKTN